MSIDSPVRDAGHDEQVNTVVGSAKAGASAVISSAGMFSKEAKAAKQREMEIEDQLKRLTSSALDEITAQANQVLAGQKPRPKIAENSLLQNLGYDVNEAVMVEQSLHFLILLDFYV